MNINDKKIKAFTLIELLVVIAIIGVLSGLVTVNLQDARERARDVQRKSDMRTIRNALELFKNDQNPNRYPTTEEYGDNALAEGSYVKELPQDPISRQNPDQWEGYSYASEENLTYSLVVCLENEADVDKDEVNLCENGVSYTEVEP